MFLWRNTGFDNIVDWCMNAIFISFDDGHYHFAKSFFYSIKANYSDHPLILVNYIGKAKDVINFICQFQDVEMVHLENTYQFDIGHMPSSIVYQRFNLWTDQFSGYENILYLDVDTIVLGSLNSIFNKNEFYICSDHSVGARIFRREDDVIRLMLDEDNIQIPASVDSMANSGMFLIPKKYRINRHYEKLIVIADKYHKYVAFSDQSIISLWCMSEKIPFQSDYENNCQIRLLYYKDIHIAVDRINILHFSGGAKPGRNPNGILGDDGVTDLDFYMISNKIRYFYRKSRDESYGCKELINMLAEKYRQFHSN